MTDDLSRRDALQIFAGIPLLAAGLTPGDVARAALHVRSTLIAQSTHRPIAFVPAFFTAHEWETVRVLVDLIIPKDARSGSATEALVPEFMDFILDENPETQTPIRGGLAWLDTEANERFGKPFVEISETNRRAILDDIAWPKRAKPEFSQGVAFFSRMRDLTASGFFSSQIGVADLRYLGNEFVMEWKGCPPSALAKLDVSYE
ncbi:MAG: gluconate 2-dehydrogenase subunit 3 family protein [Gemmatimonadota bacterium]|nr:gluconate 2-dehydrogenase subunit 3 family protein [Gemmatimonadota bacterium]